MDDGVAASGMGLHAAQGGWQVAAFKIWIKMASSACWISASSYKNNS
jgi:hypothetical protein